MRNNSLKTVQAFVAACTLAIFATVSAVIAVVTAQAGQLWPTLIGLALFAACSTAAAPVAAAYWARARDIVAALFSPAAFIVVFMVAATRAQTVDRVWIAGFGIAMWIICITIIYDRFFAKQPRPSRYAE